VQQSCFWPMPHCASTSRFAKMPARDFCLSKQLKNPRMGTTVVKNTGEARNNLGDYPKADQVEFLYYCGRMSLFERSLRKVGFHTGFDHG
jgi:hypothetical protein